jgi:hypothetical protein
MPYTVTRDDRLVLDFGWLRHLSGYRWEKGVLTPGTGRGVQRTAPLQEHPALFRDFSVLVPREGALLGFANDHGLLGLEEPDGDRLIRWRAEIISMSEVVGLWDCVQADSSALEGLFQWRPDGKEVEYRYPDVTADEHPPSRDWGLFANTSDNAERVFSGDLIGPARLRIQRVINEHLADRLAVKLLWSTRSDHLGVHVVPINLVGALWLQCAAAIEGARQYRACKTCSHWFELGPGAHPKNALYCSNNCRTRNYRQRKARAVELDREGMKHPKIASILETTAAQVRKWIKEAKT